MSLRAPRAVIWLNAEEIRDELQVVSHEHEEREEIGSLTFELLWRRGKPAIW